VRDGDGERKKGRKKTRRDDARLAEICGYAQADLVIISE
jgi:hypothetical protein